MLKELYIENLAIIEKAVINFDDNFNVFTGETGAGKSILVGGISAVAGGRVYKDIVRKGCDKGVITALFENLSEFSKAKLIESGYGCDNGELLVMREISADGKSTIRINGKTASSMVLKEITADLLDIHGQQDSRILTNIDKQRELLDEFAGLGNTLNEYADCFRSFSAVSRRIRGIEKEGAQKEILIGILQSKIKEIEGLGLKLGDEEATALALEMARGNQNISDALNFVFEGLSGGEQTSGVLDLIYKSVQRLNSVEGNDNISGLSNRLESVYDELLDIKGEVFKLIPSTEEEIDINALEEKMSGILSLKRKYKMGLDNIIKECDRWRVELAELSFSEDLINSLKEEKKALGERLKALGLEISEKRRDAAQNLTEQITKELIYLDMPDARPEFRITADKVTVNGMDCDEMYMSVNKGEEPKPIAKIASGGELSRVMLAIKSSLAESDDIPTMIFDEIDAGISGRAANKVGVKLSDLSGRRQVICVTHLAQIASKATNHLLIEKESRNERTYTIVRTLDREGRKQELARIISGDPDSLSAVNTAEELLAGDN
ncbi:MAG: DNA repair protein RecN [Eubacterium sp.]|nr:DNA repair protein RecN [Eubacterium sp.]